MKKCSFSFTINPCMLFIGFYHPACTEHFLRPNSLYPPRFWFLRTYHFVLLGLVFSLIVREGDLEDNQPLRFNPKSHHHEPSL